MRSHSSKAGADHSLSTEAEAETRAEAKAQATGRDEEYLLTEDEAVLAAALALMTGFNQGCCPAHRSPMAAKVAEQLARLADGPQVSPDMRALLLRLHQRWATLAEELKPAFKTEPARQPASGPRREILNPQALWHAPLETLQ